jgi:hypothetical protein
VEFLFVNPLQGQASKRQISSAPPVDFSHTYLQMAPESVRQSTLGYHSMKNKQTIGRDPRSDIPLNHPQVSFRHAEIHQSGSVFVITDCNAQTEHSSIIRESQELFPEYK